MISAVVLAAGMSTRMGRFKLLLPWDGSTVIRRVVETLSWADVEDTMVVTGHRSGDVFDELSWTDARFVRNPRYEDGEMMHSLQVGLAALGPTVDAALICLGDQPQMRANTVRAVLAAGRESEWQYVIIPSFEQRSGHPILLPRSIWPAVLEADTDLRAVLRAHADRIRYLSVDTYTILADLDVPEDYNVATGAAGNG